MSAPVQHKPFDTDLIDSTDPFWWHPEVAGDWHLPRSPGVLEPHEDKALIEEEADGVR